MVLYNNKFIIVSRSAPGLLIIYNHISKQKSSYNKGVFYIFAGLRSLFLVEFVWSPVVTGALGSLMLQLYLDETEDFDLRFSHICFPVKIKLSPEM